MLLTAISSPAVLPIGLTCLKHYTSTRSDSFTTIGHRSSRRLDASRYRRDSYKWEFQCSTEPSVDLLGHVGWYPTGFL